MTVGDRIRAARLKADISQTELGRACGASKQTIYKYENNVVTNIPMDKVEAMARKLGVTASYLLGWNDKTPTTQKGSGDDDKTKELHDLWDHADEAARDAILAAARLFLKDKG